MAAARLYQVWPMEIKIKKSKEGRLKCALAPFFLSLELMALR
jgi:hypothetical protein